MLILRCFKTFVVLLISYICGIVLVELKLLQVCNGIGVLNLGGKKLLAYGGGQKVSLKV